MDPTLKDLRYLRLSMTYRELTRKRRGSFLVVYFSLPFVIVATMVRLQVMRNLVTDAFLYALLVGLILTVIDIIVARDWRRAATLAAFAGAIAGWGTVWL